MYDILYKHRAISYALYHHICYLKNLQNMEIVFVQLLLELYHIHFIMNLKPNNFEQTNKIILLFFKKI